MHQPLLFLTQIFSCLQLLLGPMARRSAISIIRENAQLRVENNQLQSEIAL